MSAKEQNKGYMLVGCELSYNDEVYFFDGNGDIIPKVYTSQQRAEEERFKLLDSALTSKTHLFAGFAAITPQRLGYSSVEIQDMFQDFNLFRSLYLEEATQDIDECETTFSEFYNQLISDEDKKNFINSIPEIVEIVEVDLI